MSNREEMLREIDPILQACQQEDEAKKNWMTAKERITDLELWINAVRQEEPEPYKEPKSNLKSFAIFTAVAAVLAFLLIRSVFGDGIGMGAAVIVLAFFGFVLVLPTYRERKGKVEAERRRANRDADDHRLNLDRLPQKEQDLASAKADAVRYYNQMNEAQRAKQNEIFTPEQTETVFVSYVRQVVYDGEADSWKEAKQIANTRIHQTRLEFEARQQTEASEMAVEKQAQAAEYQRQRAQAAEWQSDQVARIADAHEEYLKSLSS
ncbi:MAG: hypothetical protein IJ087_22740 [Eggerthellaceae bacterium]|nr:hypothetical protein [Eggerthellaceae bacterium]